MVYMFLLKSFVEECKFDEFALFEFSARRHIWFSDSFEMLPNVAHHLVLHCLPKYLIIGDMYEGVQI